MAVDSESHIAAILDGLDPGSFVTKWVLVAEVIDTEGDRSIWTEIPDDATKWDMYGLLTLALERERAGQIVAAMQDGDT